MILKLNQMAGVTDCCSLKAQVKGLDPYIITDQSKEHVVETEEQREARGDVR